ncbi:MAG: RagB/SusD family nutrient uptake outer membrane protein, partial [Bacteroidota bacterium]
MLYLRFYLLIAFVIITLSSCSDDFFELERPPQSPWITLEDFDRAPVGAYGILFADREWVQAWPNYATILTSLGDDVAFVNDDQWGYLRRTSEGTDLSNRNWWLLYRGIGAVNNALDFVAENEGNPYPEISEQEKTDNLDRIVGELHFLRGFCYYMLQTTFGHAYVPGGSNGDVDIPIPTTFASSAAEAVNPTMGTTEEVWQLILSDFQTAVALLPRQFNAAVHPAAYEVRANQFAAIAMLMRTHFQMGNYPEAQQQCDFLINNNDGLFDLTEEPIEAFNKS